MLGLTCKLQHVFLLGPDVALNFNSHRVIRIECGCIGLLMVSQGCCREQLNNYSKEAGQVLTHAIVCCFE